MKSKYFSLRTLIIVAILGSAIHFNTHAQVKIGSNPTTINTNSNLEIEATSGSKLNVNKTNNEINIVDPLANQSRIRLRSADGIRETELNQAFMRLINTSPTDGTTSFIDFRGATQGFRLGYYYKPTSQTLTLTSVDQSNNATLGKHVFTSNGRFLINAYEQDVPAAVQTAALYTNGGIAARGMHTRNGTGGSNSANLVNFTVASSQVRVWIDNNDLGLINTTSDYRLKQNVAVMSSSALDRVKQLQPVSFEYKEEGSKRDSKVQEGFIAHELQAIIPSAVTGKKDELTSDGTIQPQTVNAMPVVAVLTKAIQELENKLEAQNQKIAMLEEQNKRVAALEDQIRKMANLASQLADEKRITQTGR